MTSKEESRGSKSAVHTRFSELMGIRAVSVALSEESGPTQQAAGFLADRIMNALDILRF